MKMEMASSCVPRQTLPNYTVSSLFPAEIFTCVCSSVRLEKETIDLMYGRGVIQDSDQTVTKLIFPAISPLLRRWRAAKKRQTHMHSVAATVCPFAYEAEATTTIPCSGVG